MRTQKPYILVHPVVSTKENDPVVVLRYSTCHSEETAKVRFAELALEHGGEVYLFRSEPVATLIDHAPRVTFGAVAKAEPKAKRKRRTKAEMAAALESSPKDAK